MLSSREVRQQGNQIGRDSIIISRTRVLLHLLRLLGRHTTRTTVIHVVTIVSREISNHVALRVTIVVRIVVIVVIGVVGVIGVAFPVSGYHVY